MRAGCEHAEQAIYSLASRSARSEKMAAEGALATAGAQISHGK